MRSNRARWSGGVCFVLAAGVALCGCSAETRSSPSEKRLGVAGPQESPPDQATVPLAGNGNDPLPATARAQIEALMEEKRSRTPAQLKLDSGLLLEMKRRAGDPLFAALPAFRTGVEHVRPDVVAVNVSGEISPGLLARIRALGGRVASSFPARHTAGAELPLDALEALAGDPRVRSIQRPLRPIVNKVDTSEGDVAHRAAVARTTRGLTGNGVKVGVISNGVKTLAARVTSGDLPSGITVLSGSPNANDDEGTAMLEIVHDLAPNAQLLFATAVAATNGENVFAANIRALRDQGAKVIVDDVYYPSESTFQDDVIAQAVEEVTASGVVYLSSAGNGGNLTHARSSVWEGDFVQSSSTLAVVNGAEGQTTPLHDFAAGQYWNPLVTDPATYITLEWADPGTASNNDYDLFVLDSTFANVVDAGTNPQSGSQQPLEFINSTSVDHSGDRLVVARFSGASRFLRVNANVGARLGIGTVGQISGHAAATGALGVAAVSVLTAGGGPFLGGVNNPVELFSADGPRRVFFNANSTPITPGNFTATGGALRSKPDIAAADGVSTSTPGFKPFYGTSAAAPHAAAIAALLIEQHPSYSVAQVKAVLTGTALDIEGIGFDRDSGYGLVMADRVTAPCAGAADGTECSDGNACTTNDQCNAGTCVGGAAPSCNDDNACTNDSCDTEDGCVHTNNTASCSDGDACTLGDVCSGGSCEPGSPKTCSASDACHVAGSCLSGGTCTNPNAPNGTPCTNGQCQSGVCTVVGTGGTGGTGGSTGGTGGTGGSAGGTGGTGGTGGGTGGTGVTPGASGESGASAGGDAGDESGGIGGSAHGGGTTGTGGSSDGGESGSPTGGEENGGADGVGGEPTAMGGLSGMSGRSGAGTGGLVSLAGGAGAAGRSTGGASGTTTAAHDSSAPHKSGCGCSVPGGQRGERFATLAALIAFGLVSRRRRT
ncbi:MAG TPA: S8 family serine peptidase [Polyangiaceae bacterium]|nr:S8 family serine peptidase [Polyangiaceae bacterium]